MSDQDRHDAALFAALHNNPETRADLLKLIRKHDPKAVIPELDAEERALSRMHEALKSEQEKREAAEKRLDKLEFDRQLDRARNDVIEKGLVSRDEITEVEKLITEQHFPNHETAARYYAAQKATQPPSPEQYYGNALDSVEVDFFKDADAAADKVAHDLIDQYITSPGMRRASH